MDERMDKNNYKLNDGKRSDYNKHLCPKMVDYFDDLSSSESNNIAIKGSLYKVQEKLMFCLKFFKKKVSKVNNSDLHSDDVILTKREYRLLMFSLYALIGVSVTLLSVLWYYCF